jgi:nucleotide-binding universal stress UspA family protein
MKKVLLTTDGSEAAQQAARFLARLPHDGKLELTVVSVLTPPYQGRATLQHDWIETCLERDRERAEKAFAEIEALFEGANASIEHVIVKGHAGEMICELAESHGCDLVVMGAKGHSAVARILLGSTSDYVATKAPCSVLVVRPADPARLTQPLQIALGYEDAGPAQAALEEISEIRWGKQVHCDLVTVSYRYGLMVSNTIKEMRASVDNAAARLRETGVTAKSHLIENDHFGEGLVKYAEDHHCDIFVLGETPRTQLGRVLMGSTSRYVLRHAPCSVWITRNRMIHGIKKTGRMKQTISS